MHGSWLRCLINKKSHPYSSLNLKRPVSLLDFSLPRPTDLSVMLIKMYKVTVVILMGAIGHRAKLNELQSLFCIILMVKSTRNTMTMFLKNFELHKMQKMGKNVLICSPKNDKFPKRPIPCKLYSIYNFYKFPKNNFNISV